MISEALYGPVRDTADSSAKTWTVEPNRYGTGGIPTIHIRGQLTAFGQLDGTPTWEEYTGPISRTWRYVQLKVNL